MEKTTSVQEDRKYQHREAFCSFKDVVREGLIKEEYFIQNPMDIRKERGLWVEGEAGAKALRHDCAL